jgi:hypothetical protein
MELKTGKQIIQYLLEMKYLILLFSVEQILQTYMFVNMQIIQIYIKEMRILLLCIVEELYSNNQDKTITTKCNKGMVP